MADLAALVTDAASVARDTGRPDLLRRLDESRRRMRTDTVRVMVVGQIKQGKSALVNAMVNAPICCVDDDVATLVPTVVSHGQPAAFQVIETRDSRDRTAIPLEQVATVVSQRGNPGNALNLASVEVTLPRQLLENGLTIIDTPGVGGLESAHGLTTLTTLPTADAVLLVSDASQELTEPELQFLKQTLRLCPDVVLVLSKTDLYPEWRRVLELNRAHLQRNGLKVRIIPVSSELRQIAVRDSDLELNRESGFPELVDHLRQHVVADARALLARGVGADVVAVTDHLRLALDAELHALQQPDSTPLVLAQLENAKQRADDLRRRSSRWQLTLNDGAGDLMSDLEYDLRDRMRAIQRDAETAIDTGDPGADWNAFAEWLEQRTVAAVTETFIWTEEKAAWLAEEVATHFAEGVYELPELRIGSTDGVLEPVGAIPELDDGRVGGPQKLLIGMRGSYSGVLMIGLMTGILGLTLINPISIAAGVIIGRKAYRDDQENRLKRRQVEAKQLVRKQVDEVVFHVGKQLKDRVRITQRTLRDHFTATAEEYSRSLSESVVSAQLAATRYAKDRDARVTELKRQLDRVQSIRRAAAAIAPVQSGAAPAEAPRPKLAAA